MIIEKQKRCQFNELQRYKHLVRSELTVGHLYLYVREHISLKDSDAIFFSVGNMPIVTTATMAETYDHYKEKDGFLYIVYTDESGFGGLTDTSHT